MRTVIFVCTGNTCRSPMAEYLYAEYLKSIGINDITVLSRGLAADGSEMAENSKRVLESLHIPFESRRSVQLGLEEAMTAELICVMTDSHKQILLSAGIAEDKIISLNIPDPYGGDIEQYRICCKNIHRGLERVSQRLFGYFIDEFSAADARAIAELENHCFSEPWSQNGILESSQNGTSFFVARKEEGVIGYAGVQILAGTGYITNIAVDENYRSHGIGKALTSRLIYTSKLKCCESITLEVRPSNAVAISLYNALGFLEVGRRRDFYRDPKEDALIMTKEL